MRRTIRVLTAGAVVVALLAIAAPAWAAKTVCSSGCLTNSIQSAITAASPGATITIGPGNYYENVVVNKSVSLVGSGTSTVIYPAVSNPECSGGSLCEGAASNIILVEANNVTIKGLHLEGANPNLHSGVVRGGKEISARNGVIVNYEAGTFNGLTVSRVRVSDVYLRGIYAGSEGTFDFSDDRVENVQGDESSIAMFNFGGSGVMEHNKVTGANDAISANWSRGTKFLDNIVTKSGSGIHTDNNGGSGGSADLIEGNKVSECTVNGYGIFVFEPYVSASIKSNKVTGCATGLAAFGGAVEGEGPTFSDNVVTGTKAATTGGTYGAYLTTDQLGYEFGNLTATLSGNTISRFDTGMFVTQTNPTEGQPAGGQATVTASSDDSFEFNGSGAVGEPGTSVNAKEDWWGCPAGPNMGGKCNTASGTVTYNPYLISKP
jgi:hypothetical protein